MVAQEPPSHLKHHFEAIALQRGSADGRIAKISNWRVGSNGTIYNPPAICERCPMSEIGSNSVIRRRTGMAGFMSTRPSTTLADLLRPPLVANPFSTMRASLRRESSEEFEDGVASGGQSWRRRRPVDSFFPALLLRAGDAGGRRKRSSS